MKKNIYYGEKLHNMSMASRSSLILDQLTKAVDRYRRILDGERGLTGVGFKIMFDPKTKQPRAIVTPTLEEHEEK